MLIRAAGILATARTPTPWSTICEPCSGASRGGVSDDELARLKEAGLTASVKRAIAKAAGELIPHAPGGRPPCRSLRERYLLSRMSTLTSTADKPATAAATRRAAANPP